MTLHTKTSDSPLPPPTYSTVPSRQKQLEVNWTNRKCLTHITVFWSLHPCKKQVEAACSCMVKTWRWERIFQGYGKREMCLWWMRWYLEVRWSNLWLWHIRCGNKGQCKSIEVERWRPVGCFLNPKGLNSLMVFCQNSISHFGELVSRRNAFTSFLWKKESGRGKFAWLWKQ